MEHGPLPPHERQWRHPSELAAEEREQARAESLPIVSRVFAFATGSIGLAAIAVVFLVVTPSRQVAPIAVSATTTPAIPAQGDPSATIVAARRSSPETPASPGLPVRAALATPIGAGEYAVVLRSSLSSDGEVPELLLPSGRTTSGDLMDDADATGATVLVELDERESGHRVADRRPHERDVVTVMTDPPVTVTLADLEHIDAIDGTPVVDAEGDLVGLCSERSGGGTQLAEVSPDLSAAASP